MSDIVQLAHDRGELVCDVDGYYYYWPKNDGALSEYHLRLLAKELKRLNKHWNEKIDEYFRNQQSSAPSGSVDGGQACGEDDSGDSAIAFDRTPDT